MNQESVSFWRKIFGTEEVSDKDIKVRVIRSCVGATAALCVLYGAATAAPRQGSQESAADAPRLVILGKEDEETVAVIAEQIQQEDGSVLSLDDFLNTLICGSCSRKCPLLAPRCRRGMAKAETQTGYYEQAVELLAAGEYNIGDVTVTDA